MKIIYKKRPPQLTILKEQEAGGAMRLQLPKAWKSTPRRKTSKRRGTTFSKEDVTNIMEASSMSGLNPAWIAGMTKAESGGNCLSRAWNGPAILSWKRNGKNIAQMFGEDSEALKNADGPSGVGLTAKTIFSDHKYGNNSFFHRAYKIAPKTAVYVTAWGTNQVMGWELLRLGGMPTKAPGGNPDKIVNEFFSNPCRMATKLLASWTRHSSPAGWLKRANRAATTGNIRDWNWTTCIYLGDSNRKKPGCQRNIGYTNTIIAAANAFKRDHLDEPTEGTEGAETKRRQRVNVSSAPKNLKNETIIMIGDSQMTDFYSTGIGVKLEKMLRARGANVYRFARGSAGVNFWSETLAGRRSNLTNKHTKKLTLKHLKSLNPTQIIVSLGGNDHWRTREHIKKRSGDLMEQLKSLGAPIIWYGPGDRSPSVPEGPKRNRVKQRREKVDRILGEVAQNKGIKYVSMLAFARDLYRHDKVHYYVPKRGTPEEKQKGSDAVRKYAQQMSRHIKFDFDAFYKELDLHFSTCTEGPADLAEPSGGEMCDQSQDIISTPQCCGRAVMLPEQGANKQWNEEHQNAWNKLQTKRGVKVKAPVIVTQPVKPVVKATPTTKGSIYKDPIYPGWVSPDWKPTLSGREFTN